MFYVNNRKSKTETISIACDCFLLEKKIKLGIRERRGRVNTDKIREFVQKQLDVYILPEWRGGDTGKAVHHQEE